MAEDLLGAREPERETLAGFLDWYRRVATNKLDGLSPEQASRLMTPTGLSPLGVVKHLTWCEAGWFRDTFAGETTPPKATAPESFRITAEDSIESVIAAYQAECAHSRRVVDAATTLDELSAHRSEVYGHVSLRWVLVHLLEETARHAGHLDIMRETLDGRTGD